MLCSINHFSNCVLFTLMDYNSLVPTFCCFRDEKKHPKELGSDRRLCAVMSGAGPKPGCIRCRSPTKPPTGVVTTIVGMPGWYCYVHDRCKYSIRRLCLVNGGVTNRLYDVTKRWDLFCGDLLGRKETTPNLRLTDRRLSEVSIFLVSITAFGNPRKLCQDCTRPEADK